MSKKAPLYFPDEETKKMYEDALKRKETAGIQAVNEKKKYEEMTEEEKFYYNYNRKYERQQENKIGCFSIILAALGVLIASGMFGVFGLIASIIAVVVWLVQKNR